MRKIVLAFLVVLVLLLWACSSDEDLSGQAEKGGKKTQSLKMYTLEQMTNGLPATEAQKTGFTDDITGDQIGDFIVAWGGRLIYPQPVPDTTSGYTLGGLLRYGNGPLTLKHQFNAIQVTGGTPGATGVALFSRAPANAPTQYGNLYVDISAPAFIGYIPIVFDTTGSVSVPVTLNDPLQAANPPIYLQVWEINPSILESNGGLIKYLP